MRVTYIAIIAAILVLGLGLAIYVGEKKEKKLDLGSTYVGATKATLQDLSSETLGIPLSHEELMNGDLSKITTPFTAKEIPSDSGIWYLTYPGCNALTSVVRGGESGPSVDDVYISVLANEGHGSEGAAASLECPFKTQNDIQLGSTRSEIIRAYGRPARTERDVKKQGSHSVPILGYRVMSASEKSEITFFIENGRVTGILYGFKKLLH